MKAKKKNPTPPIRITKTPKDIHDAILAYQNAQQDVYKVQSNKEQLIIVMARLGLIQMKELTMELIDRYNSSQETKNQIKSKK